MLSKYFLERPVFAWVIAIFIMLLGALAIFNLPVAQYPPIAPPAIAIDAFYPGASAQTVENSVTQIIEQKMTGFDDMLYLCGPSVKHTQGGRGPPGQIDDPAGNIRPPVSDPHGGGPAVVRIGYKEKGSEGQGPVGAGHSVHVVGLSACGLPSMERHSVPGGCSPLDEAGHHGHGGGNTAIHISR